MRNPRFFVLPGVFLTTMAILTLEVSLTRIFSVLMWYHFAFMAISLALLGSGAAGVWLYLFPHLFPAERTPARLALLAMLFAAAIVTCFTLYLRIPFDMGGGSSFTFAWKDWGWLALIYLVLAVPFLLGGAVVALALSHFSLAAGQIYFYDLVGASLGCIVSIAALSWFGGANVVLLVGVIAAAAAICFALEASRSYQIASAAVFLGLLGLLLSNQQNEWLEVRARSGYDADRQVLYERWNALSRVTVYEDPYWLQPFGWGLSPTYVGPDPGHHLLLIDGKAGTPIQWWDGQWSTIDFLRYDLTSLAYYLLPEANVFIIGPGGGRDVLTGLLFGARQITGVELNPAIIEAARYHFGDYTGYVYEQPGVTVAIEDARTYLARHDTQYDLIQASLIDTWAASSAGAFALSENGLYTREAFLTYYDRLTPGGMVSFSRWYFIADPTETLRLVALGMDAWQQKQVANPADHIVVIANFSQNRSATEGLATMLLKKSPFTAAEVAELVALAESMEFTVLHAPGIPLENNPVHALIAAANMNQVIRSYRLNIAPPTDNQPFFFNFVRPGSPATPSLNENPAYRASVEANRVLRGVLIISTLFTGLFIVGPLLLRRGRDLSLSQHGSYLLYFGALGAGFMLVEVPFIQRLTLYLGSPTYALAVVLFALLLSGGIGSLSSQQVPPGLMLSRLRGVLLALLAIIGLQLLLLTPILTLTQQWPLGVRIGVAVLFIFPAGFMMGQPFPLGLRWIGGRDAAVTPWLWAINGATSVVGSAMATILALQFGFYAVSLVGVLCYGAALALVLWLWSGRAAAA
ncbi:MAG: hypothetical protein KJ063_00215 [Anaerolineae bacterium]|nr:hypothetical protein [Anaerolineae bacterium]